MTALSLVELFLWLLLAAVAVALVAHRLGIPDGVVLLALGVALGFLPVQVPAVSSQTILLVFLPALLFQAAIRFHVPTLRDALAPIALLAVAGVGLSIAIIAIAFSLALHLARPTAVVLAAILSATDPVAVLAIFGRLNVPRRLAMIVEGESVFNDGTALVAFNIALAAATQGGATNPLRGVGEFVLVVLGGVVVGAALGVVISHAMALTSDHLIEMGLSTVAAYGAYLLGQLLHVSPVIAVLSAGIVVGSYGHRIGMSRRAQTLVVDLWDYLAFLVNSFVFLLMGLAVHQANFPVYFVPAVIAIGLVLASRGIIVYGLTPLVSRPPLELPPRWRHVIFWGGLRGAVAVAMALSLPPTLPGRNLLLTATFGVVVFTIFVQGLTMQPLIKRLHIPVAGHE
ncbi:MAG: cation:proton antiporter [Chloroflexota bacterium]